MQVLPWKFRHLPLLRPCIDALPGYVACSRHKAMRKKDSITHHPEAWINIISICKGIPSTCNHVVDLGVQSSQSKSSLQYCQKIAPLCSCHLFFLERVGLYCFGCGLLSVSFQATVKRSSIILKMLNKTCTMNQIVKKL